MFGFGKTKPPKISEPVINTAEQPATIAPKPVPEIRTMPDKFLTRQGGHGGSSRKWLVYGIVGLTVLILLGGGAFLLQRLVQGEDQANQNANLNTNTTPTNSNPTNNAATTNENTNSQRSIVSLADTLLVKSELGSDYSEYDESQSTETLAALAEVTARRVQKIFSIEQADQNTLSITFTVWEASQSSEAEKIFDFQKTRRTNQIGSGEGEFITRINPAGDQSFMFQNTDGSQSEVTLAWKYLVASIQIDVYRGTTVPAKDLEQWTQKLVANFEQYDKTHVEPVNSNSNSNANANINGNSNSNANTNASIPPTAPPPGSIDQDDDGLTDIEEILYKTEVKKPDTDADTYLDGAEVISGYSPIASGGARLQTSGLVKVFTSPLFGYSLLYPTSWIVQNTSPDGTSVAFTSETSEFIEVLVEDNPERLSPKQWYLNNAPGVDGSALKELVVGDLVGVRSTDEMTVYLGKGNIIFIIHYTIGNREAASFKTTHEMMIQSFVGGETVVDNQNRNSSLLQNVNANTNSNSNQANAENSNRNQNSSADANRQSIQAQPEINLNSGFPL